MEDKEIIALFQQRSESALEELKKKYSKLCYSIAYRILQSHEDAEECVNDSYLAFWNGVPPANPDPLSSFLCKIVRNTSIHRYHKNTRQKRNSSYNLALEEIIDFVSSRPSPDELVIVTELTENLNLFLDTLDKESRLIFVYRYWYGDSMEEISTRMGLKYNTTTVKLARTRKKLKKFLQGKGLIP